MNLDKKKIGYVYITTNLSNNKKYIGQRTYRNPSDGTYLGSGVRFKYALKKYGRENFSKRILMECDTREELDYFERFFIKEHNAVLSENYYNLSPGGRSGLAKHTEETRKKLSESHKGHKVTEETKRKLSLYWTGSIRPKRSEETKKKISESKRGKPGHKLSEDNKNKLRLSRIGSRHTEETKEKIQKKRKNQIINHSEETKRKISNSKKGHIVTTETRRKISETLIEHTKNGKEQ